MRKMGDEESHTSYVIVNMMTCPISFTHSFVLPCFLSLTVVLNLDIVRQVGIDSSCSKIERNEKKGRKQVHSFLTLIPLCCKHCTNMNLVPIPFLCFSLFFKDWVSCPGMRKGKKERGREERKREEERKERERKRGKKEGGKRGEKMKRKERKRECILSRCVFSFISLIE